MSQAECRHWNDPLDSFRFSHFTRMVYYVQAQSCLTLGPHELQPARLCLRNSPGKNPAVGCHFLLQGIFPTQGLNSPASLVFQVDSSQLSHWGSPVLLVLVYVCGFNSTQLYHMSRCTYPSPQLRH